MTGKTETTSLSHSKIKLSHGIYDAHTHVWESNSIATRSARNATLTAPGSAEGLLKLMDDNNVIQSLVITPMTLGFDNSISLDVAHRYPNRLLPVVRIDLSTPYFLETLQELCGEGARGLRINLHHLPSVDFLLDSKYTKLWLYLESANIPLFFHCEMSQLQVIKSISSKYQKIKIVIDHMGRVNSKEGIESPSFMSLLTLSELPNIYIKLSSTNYFAEIVDTHSDLSDFTLIILQKFSADRLLWGSDWPFSENDGTYASSLEPLLSMKLADRENTLKKIFYSNFKELLNA
jgi:predicted TIM-barrel fold metal-dependent hydrolase